MIDIVPKLSIQNFQKFFRNPLLLANNLRTVGRVEASAKTASKSVRFDTNKFSPVTQVRLFHRWNNKHAFRAVPRRPFAADSDQTESITAHKELLHEFCDSLLCAMEAFGLMSVGLTNRVIFFFAFAVSNPIPSNLKSEAKKAAKILRDFTEISNRNGPDKLIPGEKTSNTLWFHEEQSRR